MVIHKWSERDTTPLYLKRINKFKTFFYKNFAANDISLA